MPRYAIMRCENAAAHRDQNGRRNPSTTRPCEWQGGRVHGSATRLHHAPASRCPKCGRLGVPVRIEEDTP